MLRYTSSGKSSTYVGMMVESFGSIGSLAIKICVIITNLGVLIIYFIILGDVLCGNESNDIAHLGILQDWFGINWLTSRAFALLFVALFIMVPLVMLRRVDSLRYSSAISILLALVFVVICSSMAISALLSGKSQTPRIVPDFSQVTVIYLFTTIPVFVMGSDSMPMKWDNHLAIMVVGVVDGTSIRSHLPDSSEEMRRFLVDRASIENVNVVQQEAELEPPPNVVNEFNPNEIVRDPGHRKQINEYAPDIQDQVRRAYILKGLMQPHLPSFYFEVNVKVVWYHKRAFKYIAKKRS
ncbi:amino acid transporter AVT6C-like [Glycine max]|uniref:amino acid transporter AVT6C-like n=1 Tax=Glycine max TaxID=3847 RepID=UPI001B355251|nr:amino acid transporter AVT6C-like [Glycine max]